MNQLRFGRPANRPIRSSLAVLLAVTILAATHLDPALTPPVAAGPVGQAAGTRVAWQGGAWYLQGANVPWFNWACDFGCGANGGASAPAVQAALGTTFAQARSSGVRVLRWWTFEGDPWQVTRDGSGAPAGLNPAVYADFDAALQLAEQHDLYYNFVLFTAPSGLPPGWLTDAAQRARLAAALAPLFARYKGNPRVLSWEVFNEPDWDVWNGNVALADLRATVKAVGDAVHANSTAYVTVGMGFADGLPMVQGLGLDYYQAHWYDYMAGGTFCMRCNSYDYYRSTFGLDAPLVVGETYAGPDTDALQRFEDFYAKGYAGAWAWSLFWDHTFDRMQVDLAAAATFNGRHADLGPRSGGAPTPIPSVTPSPTATVTSTPSPTLVTSVTPTSTATSRRPKPTRHPTRTP